MPDAVRIRPLVAQDWESFSTLRLQALQECPGVYGSSYEAEVQHTPDEWRDWLSGQGKCVFGLYAGDDLIGITGVFTSRHDPSGCTGVMAASYIKPACRGRGLSAMLYKARIDWAIGHAPWKKLCVAHREGNEASRRANQKWGFVYTETDMEMIWPDGAKVARLDYELDLEKLRRKQ